MLAVSRLGFMNFCVYHTVAECKRCYLCASRYDGEAWQGTYSMGQKLKRKSEIVWSQPSPALNLPARQILRWQLFLSDTESLCLLRFICKLSMNSSCILWTWLNNSSENNHPEKETLIDILLVCYRECSTVTSMLLWQSTRLQVALQCTCRMLSAMT